MSNDFSKKEIEDNYLEHKFHNIYDSQCSTCYSNALKIPVGERIFLLIDNKSSESYKNN